MRVTATAEIVKVDDRTVTFRVEAHDEKEPIGDGTHERVVVNVHYKAEMVVRHLAQRTEPHIEFSREDELLETGGGVAKALPLLDDVFFVLNSDVVWLDSKDYALARLAGVWDPARMDAVLLFQRTATAVGYDGNGDYFLDPWGVPRRPRTAG